MSRVSELFRHGAVVGLVGNRNVGKSNNMLSLLKEARVQHPDLDIAVLGVEPALAPVLRKHNIQVIANKLDLLDMKMRDTLIFIDEMAVLFDTKAQSKQVKKLMRFIDRIEHMNCRLVVGTAREGYFNKFMCSRVSTFLVKEIEYDALVNGTWLNEHVRNLTSMSDYRFLCPKDNVYVISKSGVTNIEQVQYDPEFDIKKQSVDIFADKKGE